jgi:hypothetical protein
LTPRSLRELGARFLRLEVSVTKQRRVRPEVWEVNKTGPYEESDFYEWEGPVDYHVIVDAIGEADGIDLLARSASTIRPSAPSARTA